MAMATYPAPGRGAWRLTGGLLPAKAGATSRVGYYRMATTAETPIGSAWINGTDRSHDAQVVCLGVKAIQGMIGAVPDGWFGVDTMAATIAAQRRWKVEADGIIGPATMRAGLDGLVRDGASANQVPITVLGGILAHESSLDPAAVGVNGVDHGLAQINLSAHAASVSLEMALDPEYAIHWTGEELRAVADRWKGRTTVDVWDIAIANHNSPLLARQWAMTNEAPVVPGRVFQIQEYVENVKDAW